MPGPSAFPFPLTAPLWSLPDSGGTARAAPRSPSGLIFSTRDPLDIGATRMPDMPDADQPGMRLEARLAQLLYTPAALTFATGALARSNTLAALLAPLDEVIIDAGADPAMFETVRHAGSRVHRCPPGSVEAVDRRLFRLSRQVPRGKLFVIVPAVAGLSSIAADLHALSRLCAVQGATLIVDCSQDFGVIGQEGKGLAEVQGCLGRIDVLVGDLAASCAAPGGFAAFRDPAMADRVRARPFAPAQAGPILAALDLIDSPEGAHRRRLLHGNALRLRNHLVADGFQVMGQPSPVVPVLLPRAKAVALTTLLGSAGIEVPLIRAPDVAGHAPRWHIRLRSSHCPADIDDLADLLRSVSRAVDRPADPQRQFQAVLQP